MISTVLFFAGWTFMLAGSGFFLTAALGLLRFHDLYSRLHAVTKTDTLGLGLTALGLALLDPSWRSSLMLMLVWILVMASGAVNCQLLARYNLEHEEAQSDIDTGAAPGRDTDKGEKPDVS
jgi:multicomponent Na+:H+ antiporter subunit G